MGYRVEDFNPRLREGGDEVPKDAKKVILISIHASEKEATIQDICTKFNVNISIHASEKEATEPSGDAQENTEISIHASEKEATRYFSL